MKAFNRRALLVFAACVMLLLIARTACADHLDWWQWRNAIPPGTKTLMGVACGDVGTTPTYVAVGFDGGVVSSTDGINWTVTATGVYALGVAYGNSTFVAVGVNGSIFTSPDGATWAAAASTGTSQRLWRVAYGNVSGTTPTFVAVGDNGTIISSTDNGNTWTPQTSSTSTPIRGIGYGNGTFVAVGQNGLITTSSDGGNTWIGRVPPNTSATLYNVAYGGGAFIIATDQGGTFFASTDNGTTWTARSTGNLMYFYDIIYGSGKFVAVGGAGYTIWSSDGIAWHTANAATNRAFYGVTYGVGSAGGMYVAVGDSRTIFSSPDAATWTERSWASLSRLTASSTRTGCS